MSFDWLASLLPLDRQGDFSAAQLPDAASAWASASALLACDAQHLASTIAKHFDLPVLGDATPSQKAVKLVPASVAERYQVVPIECDDHLITLASANPADTDALQAIQFISGRVAHYLVAPPGAIDDLIQAHYQHGHLSATQLNHAHGTANQTTLAVKGRSITSRLTPQTAPTEKLFLLILREALNRFVSDVHIQPFVGGAAVRFRIDGVMQQIKSMPISVMQQLVRHIKALSDLDITNTRTPQDGRLTLLVADEDDRDLRLSILPAEGGERLVIRILANQADASHLNFPRELEHAVNRAMLDTSGVILATGPTGSGKTTTLYSMLNQLNHDAANILSVEDPVEIKMTGVSQTSVNPAQGLTFPAVLRSMLRQDPDVILVGEIRDSETAELAMRAALTGHLVLSTLHTIDALSSISRLTDLGVSPTLIADAVRFVINQRLVRKLCQSCKAEVPETELLENERLFRTLRPNSKSLFRSSGCEDCNGTGFRGRLPIAQIWELSEQSKRLLRAAVIDEAALKEDAATSGMKSLHDSGIDLIDAGETSVDEVARVNGGNFWRALGNTAMTHRSHQGSKHPITMTEKLLLVIEDERLRYALAETLSQLGYVVTAVADSTGARQHIESGAPVDLLLIDVERESATPMKAFTNLHSALAYSGLSAVLLIPEGSEALETLLEIHNASDWIRKPTTPDVVAQTVQAVLKRRHL